MYDCKLFYIDGRWVPPARPETLDVLDPATEETVGVISLGSQDDVDAAVRAARRAFPAFSLTSREERLDILDRVIAGYEARVDDLARAVTAEMGAPARLSSRAQVPSALGHLVEARRMLEDFGFEERLNDTTIVLREPIGAVGLITPWNWPLNQIGAKLAPALAVGCTVVHKPSEIAPISAHILAEVIDEAGVPAGVYNLVHGEGPVVGAAMSSHPDLDMISFTGSTRAGVDVAQRAAETVKRVTQELGGKSANIVLESADFEKAVRKGVRGDLDEARHIARRLLSGMVHLNGAPEDFAAPFGGYKMSGNGREFSRFGFEDFLETKAVMGYEAA